MAGFQNLKMQMPSIDMGLNIWLLRVLGMLGLDTTSAWKHFLHCCYSAAVVAGHIIILAANMAGIVRDLGNFDAIINNVVMTVGVVSTLARYTFIILQRQKILSLLRMLWEFQKYEWPRCLSAQCADIVTKTNRFARILTLTITFFIFLIFLSWTFSPVFTVVFSGADPTGRRLHPFLAHFFFDYQSSPSYEAVYCFQSVSLLSFCMSASNFDAMFVAFLMQAGAQYRVLTASLGKLREAAEESAYGMDYDKAEGGSVSGPDLSPPGRNTEFQQELLKRHIVQHLRKCIMHHNDIITFIKKLDDVFNPIMLAEILYSMCEIAVSGLQATENSADFGNLVRFVVFAVSLSFELYFFCGYADTLLQLEEIQMQKQMAVTLSYDLLNEWDYLFVASLLSCRFRPKYLHVGGNESQEVALTAYSCEWYHMDPQINAMLRMVIMRAQKPSKITAFHFKVICTDTYGTLLNGAYTYFALLKEIKKGSAT